MQVINIVRFTPVQVTILSLTVNVSTTFQHISICSTEVACPPLKPPANGALSCFPGTNGVDCVMSCDSNYAIPKIYNNPGGMFMCSSEVQFWMPSRVPDCIGKSIRVKPDRIHYLCVFILRVFLLWTETISVFVDFVPVQQFFRTI